MIVDATSSRFVSADGFSSATVRDGVVSLVADNDGSGANARSSRSMGPTSASLLVNTDSGDSHGISINQTSTVISGGTGSTTFTVDDDGAAFASTTTGGPVTVTGIADGVADFDAVNMRQYRKLEDRVDDAYSGIASVAAIAAIPPPVPGKKVSVGLGYGYFESENAIAVGGKALVGREENLMLTGGIGFAGSTTTVSGGVGWSF
jgi:autotransporter adhesin